MRTTRDPETDKERSARTERLSRQRREDSFAEDKALDAAVRKSIKLHGA
jgi:hypothetical protein